MKICGKNFSVIFLLLLFHYILLCGNGEERVKVRAGDRLREIHYRLKF